MRRYLPILLMTVFLLVIVLVGTTYLEGFAGRTKKENGNSLTVYTSLPVEQAALLAQQFEKSSAIQVNLVPLSEQELINRLKNEASNPRADAVVTAKPVLQQAGKFNLLEPYASEQTDIVASRFKDEQDVWTGLWLDPIIFAVNQDYLKKTEQLPENWTNLSSDPKVRLAMTDFLAADAAANLLYTFISIYGEEQTLQFFKKLHPQMIQYAKFLATPIRMAGMGECDVAIAVQSEALRYMQEGFPLQIVYPGEGTAYVLTGAALVKNASHQLEAKQFIDWLLQAEAYQTLDKNRFYFIPTNPELKKYKDYKQKAVKLFEKEFEFTTEQQHKFLDNWVQTVRLGK